MSYVGSAPAPSQVQFSTLDAQSFNGDGSTTAFTLNRAVSIAASIEVTVNNVQQSPYDGSYTVNSTTTLTFSEAPSAGTDNIYVRFLDYPLASITPADGSVTADQISSNYALWNKSGSDIYYDTGRVIVGYSSALTGAGNVVSNYQVVGSGAAVGMQAYSYSATTTADSVIEMLKSASGTVGTNSIVASGDELGTLRWSGADGTNFIRSAEIKGLVDGTPGTSDMPGALTFGTTADGASSPTERMRIDSSGRVLVGSDAAITASGLVPKVQNIGNTGDTSAYGAFICSQNTTPSRYIGFKSRGSIASPTQVSSGDNLVSLQGRGYNGTTETFVLAGEIKVENDGTPGADDMPGRITFNTTPAGSNATTERFRIDSYGDATLYLGDPDLSKAVSTGVVTYIGGREATPAGLFFSSDGLNLYTIGSTGDTVDQYKLMNPWDISALSYYGEFSVSAQDSAPTGLTFSADGTKMVITGNTNDSLYQYTLATAWNITTASYDSVSFNFSSYDTTPQGLDFGDSGNKLYVTGSTNDALIEFDLGTAYSISSVTYVASYSGITSAVLDVSFSPDGKYFFTTDSSSDDICQYQMSTPWSIATAALANTFDQSGVLGSAGGVYYCSSNQTIYVADNTGDSLRAYVLPSFVVEGSASVEGNLVVGNGLFVGGNPGYMARAWVNFDGTGTVAIRASGNVSSITDNGTGNYTLNFTTVMPDVNYAVIGTCQHQNGVTKDATLSGADFSISLSAVSVFTVAAGADFDASTVNVAIFR